MICSSVVWCGVVALRLCCVVSCCGLSCHSSLFHSPVFPFLFIALFGRSIDVAVLFHGLDFRPQVMSFNSEMIGCGLPKTLSNMKARKWSDPDIADDVEALDK